MDGAEALAYTGHRLSLSKDDAWAGYRLSQQALDELESEGKGDGDAADAARKGIRNFKIQMGVAAVGFVIFGIIALSIASSHN